MRQCVFSDIPAKLKYFLNFTQGVSVVQNVLKLHRNVSFSQLNSMKSTKFIEFEESYFLSDFPNKNDLK